MKKLFFFVLIISTLNNPQSIELSGLANGISQGMQASYTTLDRNAYTINNSSYNNDWHKWQVLNVGTALTTGVVIGIENKIESSFNLISAGVDVWYFSAIRWIVSQVTYNIHQGNEPFEINKNSHSFDKHFNWPLRIIFFTSALMFKYFILPVL